MKRMVGTTSLCLLLILPALAAGRQTNGNTAATSPASEACTANSQSWLTAVNLEHVWRLRAYEDLDCALAILDEALKTKGSEITLSRREAEQVRASVWSARDAAARIGR
jgi:hypothetical protein